MKTNITNISEGGDFEVISGGHLICTCGTKESAQCIKDAIEALESVSRDCQMALNGDWDRGDDGFEATLQNVNLALLGLGVTPPVEEKQADFRGELIEEFKARFVKIDPKGS